MPHDSHNGEDQFKDEDTSVFSVTMRAKSDGPTRHLLICTEGVRLGEVIRLEDETLRIGRHPECELKLDDQGVSRRHAHILAAGRFYFLEDLDSANGTFVQGERVTERLLNDGDVIAFGPSAAFRYQQADPEHEVMLRSMHTATITDTLTLVGNRRYFDGQLTAETAYARRHGAPLTLLMIDIDHFKAVNDTHGHLLGDEVLTLVAAAIRDKLRTKDVVARYGGEEFAVLLRNTDLRTATIAAERIRLAVQGLDVGGITVTVSIGCASFEEGTSLVEVADRRLYRAKNGGRNRIVSGG